MVRRLLVSLGEPAPDWQWRLERSGTCLLLRERHTQSRRCQAAESHGFACHVALIRVTGQIGDLRKGPMGIGEGGNDTLMAGEAAEGARRQARLTPYSLPEAAGADTKLHR